MAMAWRGDRGPKDSGYRRDVLLATQTEGREATGAVLTAVLLEYVVGLPLRKSYAGPFVKHQPVVKRGKRGKSDPDDWLYRRHGAVCSNHFPQLQDGREAFWSRWPLFNALSSSDHANDLATVGSPPFRGRLGGPLGSPLGSPLRSLILAVREKVVRWMRKAFLLALFPRGIFYRGGQASHLLAVAEEEQCPLIWIGSGESRLDPLVLHAALDHRDASSLSRRTWTLVGATRPSHPFSGNGMPEDELPHLEKRVAEGANLLVSFDGTDFYRLTLRVFDALRDFVEHAQDRRVKIVPVSVSYDRSVEDAQSGDDNLADMFRHSFGQDKNAYAPGIAIEFGEPFTFDATTTCCYLQAKEGHHVSLCLAQHLSWTIAQCRGFHPREVLAFVVVYALDRSKEVRLDVLKIAFESVVEDLIDKKRWINFSRAVSPAFQFALKALEKYLKRNGENVSLEGDTSRLSWMASRVTEAFALDACAASAVLSLVNVPLRNFSGIRAAIKLDESQLFERTKGIINLFKYEFALFPPCVMLERAVDIAIEGLRNDNIIAMEPKPFESMHFLRAQAKKTSLSLESSLDCFHSKTEKILTVNTSKESVEKLLFLHRLIEDRVIDIYRLAVALQSLLNGDVMNCAEFENKVALRIPDGAAMDYLFHSGVVRESDQGHLELEEKFCSSEALNALICHLKKYLIFQR